VSSITLISAHASPLASVGAVDAGGQNVYVAYLAGALARLGHDVRVLTRRDDRTLPERVSIAPGVTVEHIDAGPDVPLDKDELFPHMEQFADSAIRRLRRSQVSVVHSHFWMSGWVGLAVRDALDVSLVHTFHALGSVKRRCQGSADTSPPERDAVERRLVREADRIVATCSDELRELTMLGARPERVAVIPAGFDADTFHPRHDGRWFEVRRTHGTVSLVAVSRLVARKGLADVVRALEHLDECSLVVAGGPPAGDLGRDRHHRELRELAGDIGVLDRVRFTGGIPPEAVADLHHQSDLFVAAPWYEPFGIAPVEAMGCGLPVVGTAVGGLLDTVIDGGTGTLVPPRDHDALAVAIADLARQPELRHELGARAAWRAHRRFTWPVVARSIAEEYRLVADQRALRRRTGSQGRGA
jgi:glycosyltransferase involved in cell wall biosynthesis